MRDFYTAYYHAVESSRAHRTFCKYSYGRDLCQHGFMTMVDLTFLLRVLRPAPHRLLDIGCGNGRIAAAVRDATGACVVGVDFIAEAIRNAQTQSHVSHTRLFFFVGDLNSLPCAPRSFDALLSIDSIYFSDDYALTLRQWKQCLRAGGQLLIFYTHGADPEHPKASFDRATLPPDKTPLADALRANRMTFETWDFTERDYALALRKKEILTTLESDFVREGNAFLYENRMGEALGTIEAFENEMHARYLYVASG